VSALCQMTGLSRAGFYRWRVARQATPVEMELRDQMQKVALEWRGQSMRKLRGIVSWGRRPQAPGILPLYRQNGYGKGDGAGPSPAIPAAGSALRSHPCVALSSAQVFRGWTPIASPCNDLSSDGDYPLNFVSQSRGSLQDKGCAPFPAPLSPTSGTHPSLRYGQVFS
jgi:hypothetical protein